MNISYFNKEHSHPRVVVLYGNNLSDRIEFHSWDEDGTQRVKHDQLAMKLWHENGQAKLEISLKDGDMHGNYVSWFENGQIRSEGYFTDGVKNGTFKEWDEKGNVISMQMYNMGELVSEFEQSRLTASGTPIVWELTMFSQNVYRWRQTDWKPSLYTGAVVRCSGETPSDRLIKRKN